MIWIASCWCRGTLSLFHCSSVTLTTPPCPESLFILTKMSPPVTRPKSVDLDTLCTYDNDSEADREGRTIFGSYGVRLFLGMTSLIKACGFLYSYNSVIRPHDTTSQYISIIGLEQQTIASISSLHIRSRTRPSVGMVAVTSIVGDSCGRSSRAYFQVNKGILKDCHSYGRCGDKEIEGTGIAICYKGIILFPTHEPKLNVRPT